MTARSLLESSRRSPAVVEAMSKFHGETIGEIVAALAKDDVVVVGMSQNPHVKDVRKALDAAGIPFTYLEYGSYFSEWRRRLAIKMWSGWPTFPQVYVKGVLFGGADATKAAIADGSLKTQLAAPRAS
jgi:monothiol glutaredoxin